MESKWNKPFWNVIFFPNMTQETWTLLQAVSEEVTTPLPHGPLDAPPTYSFLLYIPTYPERSEQEPKT